MLSDVLTLCLQYILPKKSLTLMAGMLADVKNARIKNAIIHWFIRQYNINMHEALEENPKAYVNFNDFFIRQLKPQCRPMAEADIVSPVDGFLSEMGAIHSGTLLQAKGREYSLIELLGGHQKHSDCFNQGLYATFYLSPSDYHRIHMPITGTVQEMVYIPGKLFSVQPATARMKPNLFSRNERLVVYFDTAIGPMAMVLVGATIVGAIGTSWYGDIKRSQHIQHFTQDPPMTLMKGDEMGYFKLGSTVILLFADQHQLSWDHRLNSGDKILFGEALGTVSSTSAFCD